MSLVVHFLISAWYTLGLTNTDGMTLTMQSGLNVDMDGRGAPAGDYGAMMNGGSSSVVNNYYNNDNSRTVNQTNNSPKSLSRLEIYRMTRNALNV